MLGRLAVAVTLVLLAACGTATDEPSATRPTATPATPAPDPTTSGPTAGKPTGGTTTLTGVVGEADENGCLTLTTSGRAPVTWLLVGSTSGVAVGADVTVRGSPAPDLATRCQQGTPFVVEAVEPG